LGDEVERCKIASPSRRLLALRVSFSNRVLRIATGLNALLLEAPSSVRCAVRDDVGRDALPDCPETSQKGRRGREEKAERTRFGERSRLVEDLAEIPVPIFQAVGRGAELV
jgi:hypothetical protein